MLITIVLMSALSQEHTHEAKLGRATIYWPKDGHCGGTRANGKPFLATDDHVAHRTLPLGTPGYMCSVHTGLCVRTHIGDRGPYGAKYPCNKSKKPPSSHGRIGRPRLVRWGKHPDGSYRVCYWWQAQIHLRAGWNRRGEFDLTRPVATAIKHREFGKVVFFYKVPRPRAI